MIEVFVVWSCIGKGYLRKISVCYLGLRKKEVWVISLGMVGALGFFVLSVIVNSYWGVEFVIVVFRLLIFMFIKMF